MSELTLNVEVRDETGKNKVGALRNQGLIPGIFYGQKKRPIAIRIKETDLRTLLSQDHSIISLKLDTGKSLKSIIREIQYHPVSNSILHIDFMGVKLTEKIKSEVSIVLTGTPVGVKDDGGILEHMLRDIEIEALPLDIPPHIEVDVSQLNVGDSLHVDDLQLEKIKILTKEDTTIASVMAPRKEEEVPVEVEEMVEDEEGVEGEEEEKAEEKDISKEEES